MSKRIGFLVVGACVVVAALLLLSVPGPSVIYVITRGFSSGRAVGLLAALGNSVGVLLITGLIVLGLSALLQRFPAAVLFNRELKVPLSNVVTISVNDQRGAMMAVQHMLEQGRKLTGRS